MKRYITFATTIPFLLLVYVVGLLFIINKTVPVNGGGYYGYWGDTTYMLYWIVGFPIIAGVVLVSVFISDVRRKSKKK